MQLLVQETGESAFLKSSQVVSKVLVHTFSGKGLVYLRPISLNVFSVKVNTNLQTHDCPSHRNRSGLQRGIQVCIPAPNGPPVQFCKTLTHFFSLVLLSYIYHPLGT